jgi:hypothetical protein
VFEVRKLTFLIEKTLILGQNRSGVNEEGGWRKEETCWKGCWSNVLKAKERFFREGSGQGMPATDKPRIERLQNPNDFWSAITEAAVETVR